MARQPKLKKREWAVLEPRQLPNGKWRVSLGVTVEDGKRKNPRRLFDNQADALQFCRNEDARRKAHGQMTAKADGAVVAAWLELDAQLKAVGTKGLQAIGKQALKDAQAIHKKATAAQCLEWYIKTLGQSVWADESRTRCGRFVRRFGENRPISEATPAAMVDYFTKHPDKTGRRTISAWFSWAVEDGYLPSNPCARKRSRRRKRVAKKRGEAVILSPSNASALMRAAVQAEDWTALSFIVLGLFAGVRPMEFRKKFKGSAAVTLDWENIKPEGVEIGPHIAKTGAGRVVATLHPLPAWIRFIRKKRGKLSGPILFVGKRGGGWREHWENFRSKHWPHKWHADVLRHSFGSYLMATIRNEEKVSFEMGNSPATVLKHYWNWKTKRSEAKAFWSLTPEQVISMTKKSSSKTAKN